MPGYIGISCSENSRSSEFWAGFLQLKFPKLVKPPQVYRGACISENRNRMTEEALKLNADWIFYVDDDQIFHPLALERLLSRNVHVVSGLYLSRTFPFEPVVFDKPDPNGSQRAYTMILNNLENNHGLVSVAAVGAGALLVRRSVFGSIDKPYWRLGQIESDGWGDDLDFCYRVRKAGFKIHCDLDERVGHKIQGTVWPLYDDKQSEWTTTVVITNDPIVSLPQITVEEKELV